MWIELNNFRCWKNKTIQLPEDGLVLLEGPSGSGKSSILNAVYFCLFGVGTKVVTNGEKKCLVKMCYKDFLITRTKNPNRLVLVYQQQEYEDEVAQKIINKEFGTHFNITSYITQKMIHSFLNMSSNEKMSFLEQLVLGDENVSEIKRKTKELIRENKDNLLQKSGQLQVLSCEIGEMKCPDPVQFPLGSKHSEVKIKNESIYWKRTMKELNEMIRKKSVVETEYHTYKMNKSLYDTQEEIVRQLKQKVDEMKRENPKTVNIEELQEELESFHEALKQVRTRKNFTITNDRYNDELEEFKQLMKQEMNAYELKLNEFQKQRLDVPSTSAELEDETKKIKNKISVSEKYQQMNSHLTTLKRKLSQIVTTKGDKNEIQKQIEENESKINDLHNEKKNIDERINILECPHCKGCVRYVQGVLEKDDDIPIDKTEADKQKKKIDETIKMSKKQIESDKRVIFEFDQLSKDIERIEKEVMANQDVLEVDLAVLMESCNQNTELLRKIQMLDKHIDELKVKIQKEELSPTLRKLKENLAKRFKEVESLRQQIDEEFETDYNEDELMTEIKNCQIQIENQKQYKKRLNEIEKELSMKQQKLNSIIVEEDREYEIELELLETSIHELRQKEQKHKQTDMEIKKYLEYRSKMEEYQKWMDKLENCKKEEEVLKKTLTVTEIFYKKIQEAETISISNTIDSVNYYMNVYLEYFFTDNPITVQITPFKEVKKDIKPGINIEVFYKGSCIDINCLSGGEYDRVALSIVLALNHLFGSNLIMLDESISSLDSDLTNEILEVLKQHLKDKLVVIVAHQISSGIFDTIVSLDECHLKNDNLNEII